MFKNKKTKFIVCTILTILVLLSLNPLIGGFDYFFGLKTFKNQTFSGDVDVSITMNIEAKSVYLIFAVRYSYDVEFDFTFNAGVTDVEIEKINYRIYQNTRKIYTYNGPYMPNVRFISSTELKFRDNLTCQGSIDLNYQLNGNPQNGTLNYNLVYINSIREQDAQSYIYLKNAIFISYVASFILLPIILFFIIHPDFHQPLKKEEEKNEKYFDYLAKRKQKERK